MHWARLEVCARGRVEISMRTGKKNSRGAKSRSVRQVKRELLKIDGKSIEVLVRTDPRARRFIVKVDPSTGQVCVVSPSARSLERALDFARREKDWIAGRLARVPPPVRLETGSSIIFKGVEHQIRRGERGGLPVWIDRSEEAPTIRVGGRTEHLSRRLVDWLKREARRKIEERVAVY